MSAPLLSIHNLKKSYDGKNLVLKGLDIDIHPGEFVVVIGPSGAGKSTFARCINRMVDSTSGTMVFDGLNIESAKGKQLRQVRSKIGMIFQHYNLIGRTNVIKNVLHGRLGQVSFFKSFFGLYSEEEKREAYELLKIVGLEEHIYKKASTLSGGQMQRVGICRAIMQHPKLLLADEPIASLDPKSAKTVMDYLEAITKERSLTCIVNLHQVEFAKRYATRIIGMKSGKIFFDDVPEKLTDEMIAYIYEGKEEEMSIDKQSVEDGKVAYASY